LAKLVHTRASLVLNPFTYSLQEMSMGQIRKKAAIRKASTKAGAVFQFKITLLHSQPPIWRRIQVKDCTLDKLHEHIQTAMGWTNSHLHQFHIGEQRYADPMLMEESFEEFSYQDSTSTKLSDILPKKGKPFRFVYEYDFGDSWHHEVLFEGHPAIEPKAKYPLCLEGERACPPEDVGGVWGYADFVEAIQDRGHERHKEFLEWAGGKFNPEAFEPAAATKAMKKGLPDWRKMM
jgi:Plasmid pRiA4b ORF-3-like protein